jgi:hypothetical protein
MHILSSVRGCILDGYVIVLNDYVVVLRLSRQRWIEIKLNIAIIEIKTAIRVQVHVVGRCNFQARYTVRGRSHVVAFQVAKLFLGHVFAVGWGGQVKGRGCASRRAVGGAQVA